MEVKDNLQGINSRMHETNNQRNDMEITKQKITNKARKKNLKNENSIISLLDNLKHINICIIGVPEGEKKEQEIGNLFEKLMKENFPNLVKEIDMPVQKVQTVPNKMDVNRYTLRYTIIKTPKVKDKERIIKAAREKQLPTGEFL